MEAMAPEQQIGQATVLDLFHQVVRERRSSTSIVFEDRELTYHELDALANQFASALHNANVQPGQCVGLCIDRCPEAIAAMLGAFKIGAAFVPLDPEYPQDRIQHMLEDARIQVVITHDKAANKLAHVIDASLDLQWIDSSSLDFAELPEAFASNQVSASDLAYIMYTSGSTGKPKGVEIEHQALATYCLADIEVYRLTAEDRTLQFSTLNFDIAIEEIFPPLLIGSTVVVRPRERADCANELSSIVQRYSITALHLATAYWHEWVDLMLASQDCVPGSLRLVIATGEKVSVEHYRRWLRLCHHDVLWCNAYGPTETTVTATVFKPGSDFDQSQMPIGQPLPGYESFVLDAEFQPVEIGETAELFIGGAALARGYHNRPELTAQAFVEVDLGELGVRRLYRTGDLVRSMPDGNIDFAGRVDHQIKLGSYRIEPGEIEVAINQHVAVLESLVCHEEVKGQKTLIAYVAVGENTVTVEQIAEFLRGALPSYMVPVRYVLVPRFPKTVNGKVDRQALPPADCSQTAFHDAYVAPRTSLEQKLAELWQDILQIPQVGIYDDFFALGGSSLLVTRVVSEIRVDFGIELPVRDFFANPTVASAARHVEHLQGLTSELAVEEQAQDNVAHRRTLPLVKPCFIANGERELFAVHYAPPSLSPCWPGTQRHAVLMCQPLGHEYTRAYRNLQQLAAMLCQRGFDVIRFDYHGTGNSTGVCADVRAESMQSDTRRAADHLLRTLQPSSWSLVGVRLGATIAATTGFENPPERVVLWDPIFEGKHFVNLLEKFHHNTLSNQTRFAQANVPSEAGQLFGHAWPAEKQASINGLRIAGPLQDNHLIVTSEGYEIGDQAPTPGESLWNSVQTSDAIHWSRPEFTESAFSSPEAYREIVRYLNEGMNR